MPSRSSPLATAAHGQSCSGRSWGTPSRATESRHSLRARAAIKVGRDHKRASGSMSKNQKATALERSTKGLELETGTQRQYRHYAGWAGHAGHSPLAVSPMTVSMKLSLRLMCSPNTHRKQIIMGTQEEKI